jgi:bifunctional enzyme CysN/CysC
LTASNALSWYRGPALMAHLQMAGSAASAAARPLRIEIAEGGERSVEGRVVSGTVRRGAPLILLPACRETHVLRIATGGGEVQEAAAGTPVTLELADETGAMGGDMLADPESPPDVSDQIAAHVIWLDEEAMLPGRSYIIDCNGQQASATVGTLKHKINFDNLDHIAGPTLEQGEAGYCNLSIARPIIFDPYRDNGETGRFILIDRVSKAVAGVGMIEFGLRRATNISWQALDIDKGARAGQKGQRPCVLWFTGLSGSGKSTIANLLERRLHALGRHTYLLDGDNVRHGLNKDLGFTDADRVENIRRVAETAKLMADAGLIVMAAFISPFRSERRMARDLFEEGEFFEVFVDTPLGICEDRDPKGLYKKARAGEIKNFTGIDSDYEPPERADIHLDAGRAPAEDLVAELIEILQKSRFI